MKTRAKFLVRSIERAYDWSGKEVHTVKMTPVSDGSEENKRFWATTPQGKIEIGCANAEVAEAFELGAEYYVEFSKA